MGLRSIGLLASAAIVTLGFSACATNDSSGGGGGFDAAIPPGTGADMTLASETVR